MSMPGHFLPMLRMMRLTAIIVVSLKFAAALGTDQVRVQQLAPGYTPGESPVASGSRKRDREKEEQPVGGEELAASPSPRFSTEWITRDDFEKFVESIHGVKSGGKSRTCPDGPDGVYNEEGAKDALFKDEDSVQTIRLVKCQGRIVGYVDLYFPHADPTTTGFPPALFVATECSFSNFEGLDGLKEIARTCMHDDDEGVDSVLANFVDSHAQERADKHEEQYSIIFNLPRGSRAYDTHISKMKPLEESTLSLGEKKQVLDLYEKMSPNIMPKSYRRAVEAGKNDCGGFLFAKKSDD